MTQFEEKYTWEFEHTNLFDGLNNPMIEHFSGGYYHLAREIIQNAIDARDKEDEPVRVEFKMENLPSKFFPGIERYKKILNLCRDSWNKNPEVISFADNALKIVEEEQIQLLRISDFNTIGLKGQDNDMEGGWFSLVKSRGASSKRTGEGGSFGIGKGAAFKTSPLRTVFYSTYSKDGFKKFQGIAELVTFKESESARRGTGSFGSDNYGSISRPQDIPEYFQRKEMGLDIFIAGSTLNETQKDELIKSILRNFWYAIHKNELLVMVGEISVSKESLENLLIKHFEDKPTKDHVEPIGNPLTYYQAVIKGKSFERDLPIIGKVIFYFYKTSEYLNHVAMIRKSHMVIYSKPYRHPESFAGVFICNNKIGNNELRKMEPPAHDKWDPERNKDNGNVIIEGIGNWIRDTLKELREIEAKGFQEIPDLAKYLPFNDEPGRESGGDSETFEVESDEETSSLMQKKSVFESLPVINPYSVSILNSPDSGFGNGGTVLRRKDKGLKTKKKRKGGGPGANPAKTSHSIKARTYLSGMDANGVLKYTLIIHPTEDIKCSLKLMAVGEEGEEQIQFLSVKDSENKDLRFKNNTISLVNLESGKPKKIKVEFESKFKVSLKVHVNDLQQ